MVSHGLVSNTLSNQSPRARPIKVAMTMVSPRVLESPTSLRAFLVSSFMKATSLLLARPPAHELRLLKDSTLVRVKLHVRPTIAPWESQRFFVKRISFANKAQNDMFYAARREVVSTIYRIRSV